MPDQELRNIANRNAETKTFSPSPMIVCRRRIWGFRFADASIGPH
jgi:hypothetical protein